MSVTQKNKQRYCFHLENPSRSCNAQLYRTLVTGAGLEVTHVSSWRVQNGTSQATLIQAKVNQKAAQHRLGHTQMSLTMNVYAKSLDSDEIASAEAMNAIVRPTN